MTLLKKILLGVIFFTWFSIPGYVIPCTSFVVKSDKVYYGMNFDWPDTELWFCINKYGSHKYFDFRFYKNSYFSTTAGMNENGVFSSIQMLYPEVSSWETGGFTLWDSFLWPMKYAADIESFLSYVNTNDIKITHINGLTLHNILADRFGNACILEIGQTQNKITHIENGMLVMANFENHQFQDVNYQNVAGVGADRYKAAYAYILEHKDNFSREDGFEVLSRSIQPAPGDYSTQCSMLFDPAENDVYIVLKRDFDRVWKLSIDDETIETYSGFNNASKLSIDAQGIYSSQLEAMTNLESGNFRPAIITLHQNYPNPFNSSTTIRFTLQEPKSIALRIYNLAGQEADVLINEIRSAGDHYVRWQADSLPGGIYFVRLQSGKYIKTMKLILCK